MRIRLFLLLTLVSCFPAFCATPILRAVLVADTSDNRIGNSVQADVWQMQKTLEVIARKIGCQLDVRTLVDERFCSDEIENWLVGLPKDSNDIVFFYYSGHGTRDGLKKPWPVLAVWNKGTHQRLLGGTAVVKYLKRNNHRLTIILFDCCNGPESDSWHFTRLPRKSAVLIDDRIPLPSLKSPFLKTKGIFIGAAAEPKEGADCRDGDPEGSVFSVEFIRALIRYAQERKASWKAIARETYRQSVYETKENSRGPQHAVFEFDLRTSNG